jgi:tetratricopeptide (TPR) repeat protein
VRPARGTPADARASGRRIALHCACAWALSIASSCWSNPVEHIPDSTSSYDVLPEEFRPRFDAARVNMDAGRLDLARPALEDLCRELPDNLFVGIWLQEVELAASSGPAQGDPSRRETAGDPPGARSRLGGSNATDRGTAPSSAEGGAQSSAEGGAAKAAEPEASRQSGAGDRPLDELRQRYRRAADDAPTVARLVLAARLEDDEIAADVLLDRAQAIDSRCAWIHYARAWFAARANRWPDVRSEIAAAKEIDPGHMPTRWLDAWMLARGGGVREAISALEGWLDRARGDLRLDVRLVREAELDLALLCVLDGDPKRAHDILTALGDDEVDAGRKWSAIAPTDQALGDEHEALTAAQHAEEFSPGEILPVVQQALLYESWLGNPDAAEAAWTRALALSRGSSDLAALLERVRARVHVERLRAERERKRDGSSSS